MRQGLRWRRWWPGSAGTASTDKARRWRLNGQRRQAPSRTGKRDYSLQIRGYEGLTSNSGVCSFEYRRTKWASRLACQTRPKPSVNHSNSKCSLCIYTRLKKIKLCLGNNLSALVYQLASQDFQLQAKNQNKEEKLHRCATIHYTASTILRAYYVFTLK